MIPNNDKEPQMSEWGGGKSGLKNSIENYQALLIRSFSTCEKFRQTAGIIDVEKKQHVRFFTHSLGGDIPWGERFLRKSLQSYDLPRFCEIRYHKTFETIPTVLRRLPRLA
ncbi:hypothetical protein M4951_04200 [Blastopirellula sp. J2-11]|uniref:hypothetical protein n=1 Tax=Blastopirellula sp. J2-11 TaxID=2943192 RepID=UPI0021C602A5|nr:hypothetical protein [Blastopirellula sp. J2-11]UUO07513.1 hypothetical protein M4951_04200 [Blastopirellula sp. J2-11]